MEIELKRTKEPETPEEQAALEVIHSEMLRRMATLVEWMEMTETFGDKLPPERLLKIGRESLAALLLGDVRQLAKAGLLTDEVLVVLPEEA
jgi:hypothetical protein